jgi:hypothetical protein
MLGEFYIFLLAGMIPFFHWQQREEGRNYVSALITGVFLILWLATGLPFTWDTTTMLVTCFGLWMVASIFWSNSRQSSLDLYSMITGLVVFLVARRISLDILLPILFIPGAVFAFASLYYHRLIAKGLRPEDMKKAYPIFGNPNHIGAFLLVPLFTGVYLAFNVSLLYVPFVIMTVFATALNRCRGAQIAVISGLMYIACVQTFFLTIFLPFMLAGAWMLYKSRKGNARIAAQENMYHRFSLLTAAWRLIKKAPMGGYGLRSFRREYPNLMADLRSSKYFARSGSLSSQTSHRIHNDFLEIIVELGIIGLILFLSIFTTLKWPESPFFSGAIIAFAVHGLFFFPLREAHTAYPFWALAGAMAGTSAPGIQINPIIAVVLILITGKILYEIAVKTIGLSYYDKSVRINVLPNAETEEGKKAIVVKRFWIDNAIKCDPYNNVYLTEGYYYNVFENPEPAFQYASRCMENYDGGKVKWGVCDQYARALLRLGGFGVAKMAVKYALHICPDFKQSIDLMGQLDQMEGQQVKPV